MGMVLIWGRGGYYSQLVKLPPVVLPVTRPIVCPSHYGRYCVAVPVMMMPLICLTWQTLKASLMEMLQIYYRC